MNREHATAAGTAVVISVVMPAFNAERTVEKSITSILQQTFQRLEILVGDDASTDGTASIVASFHDDRIRLFRNTINQGPGVTRDYLLAQARGQWIAFCDADDFFDPTRLAVMLNATKGDTNVVVFDDIMQCHDVDGKMVPWRRLRGPGAFGAHDRPVGVDTSTFFNNSRFFSKPLFSKFLLASSGIRHSRHPYGEDTFFLLKLIAAGRTLVYVPEALYAYRITPGSASSNKQRRTMLREVIESCIDDFKTQPGAYVALRRKLDNARRAERYTPFAEAIKRGHFAEALHLLRKRPALFLEFIGHAYHDLHYHAHRIYNRGTTRGSK